MRIIIHSLKRVVTIVRRFRKIVVDSFFFSDRARVSINSYKPTREPFSKEPYDTPFFVSRSRRRRGPQKLFVLNVDISAVKNSRTIKYLRNENQKFLRAFPQRFWFSFTHITHVINTRNAPVVSWTLTYVLFRRTRSDHARNVNEQPVFGYQSKPCNCIYLYISKPRRRSAGTRVYIGSTTSLSTEICEIFVDEITIVGPYTKLLSRARSSKRSFSRFIVL